jgi:hypothetical protein
MINFLININQWLKRSNVNNIHSLKFDQIISDFTACDKIYYSILFIYYLLDNSWLIYVPLSSARQNKESEKGLFNTNKQKTNTRTYVNQRDDMLTKTRN